MLTLSGLWIPSNMLPRIPGPSSTERGLPVLRTGSPTHTPAGNSSQGGTQEHETRGTTAVLAVKARGYERQCSYVKCDGYRSPRRLGWWHILPPI